MLAKELLDKEVLHKSDVETLIGKRPFEEKKLIEIEEELDNNQPVGEKTFGSQEGIDQGENNIIG